ncbi:MAG: hypothetical protein IKR59_06755 [Lachnospiraceae bacterium]|nr:hypothetical protein [Lachnospiraceae bacterium]
MDLSDGGYGVSLLNDCKYGHSFLGGMMTISLIKTGTYPDYAADLGRHEFTYSLLPHSGSWREAGTVQEAAALNRPFYVLPAPGGGTLPAEFSLVTCDAPNIIAETAKKAEDGEGIVLRLYETQGARTNFRLRFGTDFESIKLANLLEQATSELGSGSEVELVAGPYDIITLLLYGDRSR